jgi:2-amino-4-hydroxy-6-hydroxymethyldihydropteridine diphosphokinase
VDRVAAVALGSNLGDRHAHLNYAVSRLRAFLANLKASNFIETDPVDVSEPQPRYLNAVAVGQTTLSPREVLDALLAIERERGRERPHANAPRTLDLDLILLGDLVIDEPGLSVPHPRFAKRRFVLEPLASIAPDLVDPRTGRSIGELVAAM